MINELIDSQSSSQDKELEQQLNDFIDAQSSSDDNWIEKEFNEFIDRESSHEEREGSPPMSPSEADRIIDEHFPFF